MIQPYVIQPNPWKIAAVCLGAAVAYLWFAHRPAPAPDLVFAPVTNDPGVAVQPAISADGHLAVYASDREARNLDLYIQPLPRGVPMRLTTSQQNESEPALSPDSGAVAFRSEQSGGALYTMPARGGEPRLLVQGGHDPRYSPDGKWIAYWDQAASFVIPSAGGTPRRVFPELQSVRHPVWSPDGSRLMAKTDADYVSGAPDGKAEATGIAARLEGQPSDGANWTAAGLYLVRRTGWVRNIWRVPVDSRGRATAAPVRITQGAESTDDLAVSRDGRILFSTGTRRFNVWAIPVEANTGKPTGAPYRITEGPAAAENPAISEDGRRLLYDAARFGVQQVFLRDLDTGAERAVATGPLGATAGHWLPDGRIAYRRRTQTGAEAWMVDPATGESSKLAADATPSLGPKAGDSQFSPDGRLIYFIRDAGVFAVRRDPPGEPFVVWQSRDPRLSLEGVNPAALSLGIARDKLVLLLAESNSNLWLADPR
jgi:Tol biopolymer transport system component